MREQKKKRIKDIIINQKIDKNYITGIYNYCDRWCEKCSFTKRCMNYSMGEAFGFDEKDNDLNNKEFWENISMIFEVTAELLVEKAKEFGIDLTKVDEDFVEREERGHPLIDSSHNFSTGFEKWLDANNDTFRKRILLYTETGNKSGTLLSDTVEILYWYTFLIPAKFYKILINKEEGCQEQELIDYENGTIKIALIGIDRLIGGLGIIMENFSEMEDDCLGFMVSLSRLKNQAENIFPDAKNFIRPGLDENY